MKRTISLLSICCILSISSFAQGTGDPWIKKVFNDTWGRDPQGMEWNIKNYNDGHWNSYTELMKAIYEYRKNTESAGISYKYSAKTYNGNLVAAIYQNGIQLGVSIISTNGCGIVAQGGGNIVAQGGGNIVAQGGGNIVAQGGGNIQIKPDSKGFFVGSSYTVMAAGGIKIKTSGSGALIIQ